MPLLAAAAAAAAVNNTEWRTFAQQRALPSSPISNSRAVAQLVNRHFLSAVKLHASVSCTCCRCQRPTAMPPLFGCFVPACAAFRRVSNFRTLSWCWRCIRCFRCCCTFRLLWEFVQWNCAICYLFCCVFSQVLLFLVCL